MAIGTTSRERMLATPFNPGEDGTSADWRQIVAVEYIAVYLGEINKNIATIAALMEVQQANAGAIVQRLDALVATRERR